MIRVDVTVEEGVSFAIYVRIDEDGEGDHYTSPLGPDTQGIGLPTMAIIDLIRDLNWADITGMIFVAHRGVIGQNDLERIMTQVSPAYAIRNLATTATVQ